MKARLLAGPFVCDAREQDHRLLFPAARSSIPSPLSMKCFLITRRTQLVRPVGWVEVISVLTAFEIVAPTRAWIFGSKYASSKS